MKFILLFALCVSLSGAANVPLPDYKVLGQPFDQSSKTAQVVDPAYAAAHASGHITGGYSYGNNKVLRLDWAYPTDRYTEKDIEKAVMTAFRPTKVHEGVIDDSTTRTWYVKELNIWIRLSHSKAPAFSNQFRLEYVNSEWVGIINAKFAALYPLPKK